MPLRLFSYYGKQKWVSLSSVDMQHVLNAIVWHHFRFARRASGNYILRKYILRVCLHLPTRIIEHNIRSDISKRTSFLTANT